MSASTSTPVSVPAVAARHVTSGGTRVYTLTVPAFPHFAANVFVVVRGEAAAPTYTALIDTGGSHEASTAALDAGLDAVRSEYGEAVAWDTLSRVVITHPHPDHVAGLPFVHSRTAAPVAAHEWAVATIQNPAGDPVKRQADMEDHLLWLGLTGGGTEAEYAERLRRRARNTMLPEAVEIQTPLKDGDVLDNIFTVIYTPGHEGSQVCLRVDDLLLSADHLLPRNSPPLMPERFQRGAGLGHYLDSLDRIEALEGVSVALGGHDGPMHDWKGRIQNLRDRYDDKLRAVLNAAAEPITIHDLTHALNPRLRAVQAILLLDQTAALVEYLVGRGQLVETRREDGAALVVRTVQP
ncbi:MBL fold metallo-hydrolase [Deinococcus arenicola]|uniref:MBL fold metallo-hydrolase n=1 Tax=Deinococcus arenicola TaxID=2994950 RepID=A0ABU4DKX3_9DEIO|nr:MBL fold metallo-hydrolase [Deinococcus sp. ZS9-10]MDV6373071.1 MBL fold metallo-hydrolase [Deinococcus sp. ZS9-10]